MLYLYLKAFHIIFFTSWFAGLFYLPRIYVNLAMVNDQNTYNHLLTMARKLYRFVTPFMFITVGLGIWMLYLNAGLLKMGWMHVKLTLIGLLIGYHFLCGHYLKKFTINQSTKGHVYYRFFNEFPVLILFAVVILAVTKAF
ncbi:CopD family protein [Aliikangiella coralliicola]|uniref:Protoporphyrinogen IX oxidase n=2 Tax=Aliikangiella coralliicola TaxID=2592383 RepID=A0A545U813_9GAMM|nr:CopD family protein [Aliikangiella coralliicola]TQV85599.1 CopD family protein [Aliikangiella coralliicola]